MADAGRILIMPKGKWDANTEYEMLDLVYWKGSTWIAKKNSKGVEPISSNHDTEYWQRVAGDSMEIAFGSMLVECSEGTTGYEFDLSDFEGVTIEGVIHHLGQPTSWEFNNAALFQKSHTEGVIKTDAPNSFYVHYVAFYR